MLNITNHQENANQKSQEDFTSHLSEWLSLKRTQMTNVGQDAEKREPSCTAGGNVSWCSYCGKTIRRFLKKTERRTNVWPSKSTSGYIWRKTKMLIWKDTCTPMYPAALFTIAKIRKQPKCLSTDKWIKKMWYIYPMATTQPLKIMKFCFLQQHGQACYAKWCKWEKDKYCILLTCGL